MSGVCFCPSRANQIRIRSNRVLSCLHAKLLNARTAEERIHNLAYFDSLTRLPSRLSFLEVWIAKLRVLLLPAASSACYSSIFTASRTSTIHSAIR